MSQFLCVDVPEFSDEPPGTCACCLSKHCSMINITNCRHISILDKFTDFKIYIPTVCHECHIFLEKIEQFMQKVVENQKILSSQALSNEQETQRDKEFRFEISTTYMLDQTGRKRINKQKQYKKGCDIYNSDTTLSQDEFADIKQEPLSAQETDGSNKLMELCEKSVDSSDSEVPLAALKNTIKKEVQSESEQRPKQKKLSKKPEKKRKRSDSPFKAVQDNRHWPVTIRSEPVAKRDPFLLEPRVFEKLYRITRHKFQSICDELRPMLCSDARNLVELNLKILAAITFYGQGSFTRYNKPYYQLGLSPAAVAAAVEQVTNAFNTPSFLNKYIRFPCKRRERELTSDKFMVYFDFPNTLGAIDSIHFGEIEHTSKLLSVILVCDPNTCITYVVVYPATMHESDMWNKCSLKAHLRCLHKIGEWCWLVGGPNFSQSDVLMTPIDNPEPNSPQEHYNTLHFKAKQSIDKCIRRLKGRWPGAFKQSAKIMLQDSSKAAKIINACAVLHNICNKDSALYAVGDTGSVERYNPVPIEDDEKRRLLVDTLWDQSKIKIINLSEEQMRLERSRDAENPAFVKFTYKCHSCIVGFDHEQMFVDHMKKHDKKVNGVKCEICASVLCSKESYQIHFKRHYIRYECLECGKRYLNRYTVLRHYESTHSQCDAKHYNCNMCDYKTTCQRRFRYHATKHKEKAECHICGNKLVNKCALKVHLLTVHRQSSTQYKCEPCGKVYRARSGLMEHNKAHHSSHAMFYCPECDLHFKTAKNLRKHLTDALKHRQKGRDLQCNQCEAKFQTVVSLKRHVDFAHSNVRFDCDNCGKAFSSRRARTKHVDFVHEKKRPPRNKICDYCGLGFTTSQILATHIRTHTRARPLRCARAGCRAAFAHPAALYSHAKTHAK